MVEVRSGGVADPAMRPEVLARGTVLGGRYVVGEQLGSGGWGTVYDGVQQDLGRRVAIKALRMDRVLDDDGLARFVREARAAAALGHPNIAQVTDFQANPGEPAFMVMEHLVGRTLGALLRSEPRLPAGRVAAIAHQVLSALEAAHRAGIVHRDVKPDNIFLVSTSGHEDFVKLLDFGIAKLASEESVRLTGASTILGTPAFMAPEQVAGGSVDARTDLYAVGTLMYLALAGRPPLEAPSLSALLYAIVHHRPPPLASVEPGIDPGLSLVVERAMHKDREGRFGSAAEMRAAIEACSIAGPRPVWMGSLAPPHVKPVSNIPPTDTMPAPQRKPGAGATFTRGVLLGVVSLGLLGGGAWAVKKRQGASVASSPAETVTSATPDGGERSDASSAPVDTASPPPDAGARTVPSKAVVTAPPQSIDAGAPLARARMTGRTPRITGGTWPRVYGGSAGCRKIIETAMPSVTACHVASEYEPPNHESSDWFITVDALGKVTNVRRSRSVKEKTPAFETCMARALGTLVFPTSQAGADVRVFFDARL